MKEIEERLVAEQQEKEPSERQQTRSQTDKPGMSAATDMGTELVQRASQRKRKADNTVDTSDGNQTAKTEIYYQIEERIWWQEA